MNKPKLIRITTVPISLKILLKGQLKWMSTYFEVVGVSSSGEEVQEVRDQEGIRVEEIQMSRQITPFQDLISLVKMIRFLQKEKPQIVHSHTPKAGIIGMLAAKIAGVPIRIHTVAGLPLMEASGMKRKILLLVEKFTYWSATEILPNSKGLEAFILQGNLVSCHKIQLIGKGSSNGIDTQHFDPETVSGNEKQKLRKELHLKEDDFVFVFVGRLVADKGIQELVSAFSQLKIPNAKLLLVGPFEPELDPLSLETMEEIKNNPSILSVGFQSDVRPYFAISNVLVFPSYREGFPNVVMQAGAMGLPSIVSNINGCNEIIQEEVNGLIIPVKDENAVYSAMKEILENSELYHRLTLNARERIRQGYEQEVFWQELLKEYQRLMRENSAL